jgi:hypothetical protein
VAGETTSCCVTSEDRAQTISLCVPRAKYGFDYETAVITAIDEQSATSPWEDKLAQATRG